ncbi:MAG: penicillin acylase family protein [Bryobacter sp.]|nr:penicillin acylase family protein [Bryobacter sp.]
MRTQMVLLLLFASLASAAPRGVEILWDRYGVAHVYAKDLEGVFFGYGYAQMQSHANLVLKLYGESRGRSAEYWGEKGLALDRWVHTNDIPERSAAWFAQQTPEFQKYLTAFAEGMNEYARKHPEAIAEEYRQVLPIRPVDSLQHTHRIVNFNYVSSQARVQAAVTSRAPALGGIGSNAWAIAPAKSKNGSPMLLMNPHLPWQDWFTYYEIHLNAPGVQLYGASQIGFPVLRFVFSNHLGFTQTVNSIDGSDLYRLTPDGDGYRFDGERRSFERRTVSLQVKGKAAVPLEILKTVHGPVVWNEAGKMIAMRTAGLDRPFLIEQYWKMALAKNFREYEAQLRRLQVPSFNITYADKAGHIQYHFNGLLPKRKKGDLAYWAGIVEGDTSETLWTDYHAYEELPKVSDPSSGWVQNTNDPPWTATLPSLDWDKYPAYTAGRDYTMRTRSSLAMLNDTPKLDFAQLVAFKHSTRLVMADRLLPDLLEAAPDSPAKQVLAQWDRNADNASPGAVLFTALMAKFKPDWRVPPDPKNPLNTPMGLKNADAAVKALAEAAREVESKYGSLAVAYGQVNRFRFRGADLPGNGADGALGAFRVIRFGPKGPVHGDTFVACVEWTKRGPQAQVLLSYGNSSQPGTKHDADQLPLLSEKKLRTAWLSRKDVEKNLESRDVF